MRQNSKKLNRDFFDRGAEVVAKNLLGKKIIRTLTTNEQITAVINETEAYLGIKDKASHSYGGRRTKRNEIMYGPPGFIYVYFTYGMHWLMNFIVSGVNDPQAVLIRGVGNINGPARVTRYLNIDKTFYGEDLTKSKRIFIEDTDMNLNKQLIQKLPRVGIDYAEEWKDKPLRFLFKMPNVEV